MDILREQPSVRRCSAEEAKTAGEGRLIPHRFQSALDEYKELADCDDPFGTPTMSHIARHH